MKSYRVILKNGTRLFADTTEDIIEINLRLNISGEFVKIGEGFIVRKNSIAYIEEIIG